MKPTTKIGIFVGMSMIVIVAVGIGFGLRHRPPNQPAENLQPQTVVETPAPENKPADLTDEDREFLRQLDEEISQAKEQEAALAAQPTPAPEPVQPIQPAAQFPRLNLGNMFRNQSSENMPQWRKTWNDLNLTPDEEERLRRGFGLIMQRWQSMSPEERQTETQRLQSMGQRWQTMSEEERNAVSQRMRDRFEDWRDSGTDELPELSLD